MRLGDGRDPPPRRPARAGAPRAGLRVTQQRVAVLDAVRRQPHADTDSLISAVRAETGDISHQAVYDVLKALTDARLVRKIQPLGTGGALRGPGRRQPPPRGLPRLRDDRRRRLRRRRHAVPDRVRRHGFVIDEAEVIYWGTCPNCTTRTKLLKESARRQEKDRTCPRARTRSSTHPSPRGPAAHQPGLVAQPARPERPAPAPPRGQPAGRRLRLRRRSSPSWTSTSSSRDIKRGPQHLPGLVAGRLRPLRRPDDPAELARGRHLPDRGRPRWRRRRQPAVRAAEQLAGQRQPRQGAPPAVAGQAEARPEDLLGRPAGLRRQRRAGGHGLRDLRLRLRPRGHLGARGGLLGTGGHLARRRALQRRP